MEAVEQIQGQVGQRAELTFKHNRFAGRHGWLRLTPAYSVKVVHDILRSADRARTILDPFSGTGTTALCAADLGHRSVAVEVNPFLVWLGRAKLARYEGSLLRRAAALAEKVPGFCSGPDAPAVDPPPLANLERWWSAEALSALRRLKAYLDGATQPGSPESDLLRIAFCRTVIASSNAAFNHQSMSFKSGAGLAQRSIFDAGHDTFNRFSADVAVVLEGAARSPSGSATVVEGDSRRLGQLGGEEFDLLITSPPYPNRISYVRELRPYMYWLGFLREAREAGELDWLAIGGTWGIATSRLNDWKRDRGCFTPAALDAAIKAIAAAGGKNSVLLSAYVAKYFEDIWQHIQSAAQVVRRNGEVHYIVGNVTFYGVVVSVEEIYAEMLRKLGFRGVAIHTLRKRNSNKNLFEFDVSATR